MRQHQRVVAAAILVLALPGVASASGVGAVRPRDKPLSATDRKAHSGARLVLSAHDLYNTAPTGTFVDIAVSTVGVAFHDDFGTATEIVGGLMQSGLDCMKARKPTCKFERAGVSFDFVTGRHSIALYPVQGFSTDPAPMATEDAGGIRISNADAYGFVVNEEKSALRSMSFGTPGTSATARDVPTPCGAPASK